MKTRREFIKISGLGLAGAAVAGSIITTAVKASEKNDSSKKKKEYDKLERTPTYCEICFWKCAGWVYKNEDGSIKKIIGNDEDQHSSGRFCPRGTGGIGSYTDEDRLKKPMIRKTVNGKQVFEEVEWDKAFDFIASKMRSIKQKFGAESIALFTHGSGGSFWGPLLKAYGSDTNVAPSYAQCKGPRDVAFTYTFGEELHSPEPLDIKNTKCLVLIGSHLGENMHNGQVQEMSDAIDQGATIITVDPRFSTVASKSKYWLPIKPATDTALLLAWMHVLINENIYDIEYVEKYAHGFEELKEHVKTFTPEWAYGITTIHPDQIRETARAMANASPAVIINPGRHTTWYGDDTQRLRSVAILNALLGSWGRRGGFYLAETQSLPSYPGPKPAAPAKTWTDALNGNYSLGIAGIANEVINATIPENKRDLTYKAWFVNGTNLINTIPDQKTTLKAIQNLELMVVIDTMPMEITGYADVILPECTYLERYDTIRVAPYREPAIALRMPAVEPLYDSKPGWWMVKQLARKLGLGAYFPWSNVEEMLDWQLKQVGSSLKEMQKIGVKTFPRVSESLYFQEGVEPEFATPTGKIELFSTAFADAGFDPLPKYVPMPEPPEGFYRLNYGRAPMHTFTRTSNNPYLTDLMDTNHLWVNPRVAKEWGLKNEQHIYLKNQDGVLSEFTIPVRVTERIRWDSVYMVHGFGHKDKKLSRAFGRGISDTDLITNVLVDPIMGGTGMRGNFVTFVINKEEA